MPSCAYQFEFWPGVGGDACGCYHRLLLNKEGRLNRRRRLFYYQFAVGRSEKTTKARCGEGAVAKKAGVKARKAERARKEWISCTIGSRI
jgi:hypothetical protein